jgi:predicted RNase H-like HicB family nuclease
MERKRKVQGPDGDVYDATEVGFRSSGEHWNEYLLDDGTVERDKLIALWADIAVRHAIVRRSEDPGELIATVTDLPGAWGAGETPNEALSELHSVLIGWATLKLDDGDRDIPDMEGIRLVLDA